MIIFDPDKKATFNPNNLNLVGNPKRALMIFDDEVWENHIQKNKDLKTLPVKNNKGKVFGTFRMCKYDNENVLLTYPETGGSASAMYLELLIASGVEKIVAFGTCGAMDKNIAKNTVVIPTTVVREEGVSYHYLPPSDEVDQSQNSVRTMKDVFSRNNVDFLEGKVWTTDAVYRETADKLKIMKDKGCIAVDMELASLLAVAKFRETDFASFLITDDNIDGKCLKQYKREPAKILDLALRIVTSI
jgi:uridine phosphorylase